MPPRFPARALPTWIGVAAFASRSPRSQWPVVGAAPKQTPTPQLGFNSYVQDLCQKQCDVGKRCQGAVHRAQGARRQLHRPRVPDLHRVAHLEAACSRGAPAARTSKPPRPPDSKSRSKRRTRCTSGCSSGPCSTRRPAGNGGWRGVIRPQRRSMVQELPRRP